jgi:hypothetical protein
MPEYLWFFVVVGGPAILGALLALGIMQKRRFTSREQRARRRATETLYSEPEEDG